MGETMPGSSYEDKYLSEEAKAKINAVKKAKRAKAPLASLKGALEEEIEPSLENLIASLKKNQGRIKAILGQSSIPLKGNEQREGMDTVEELYKDSIAKIRLMEENPTANKEEIQRLKNYFEEGVKPILPSKE